jgi:hypothetical protein
MDVVITASRGQGKTTELIRYAAAERLTIVTADMTLACHVTRMAADLGLRIPGPVSWRELGHGSLLGRPVPGLAIDDLDLCIQQWTRVPVRAATLSVTPPR